MTDRFLSRVGPVVSLLIAGALVGCVEQSARVVADPGTAVEAELLPLPIFSAGDAVEKNWRAVTVWGESEIRLVAQEGEIAIRAETDKSSIALIRGVEIDPGLCPEVEWLWRVDAMPLEADLASRQAEDVAASVFFAFGDPGAFTNPDPVPTIRYAWATETNPVDEVVDSPYFPGVIRTVVVRSGPADLETWITERRNIVADYELAFGEKPEDEIEVFAIFTDSDHDNGPAIANYRWARALCTELPEGPSIF
ncbi:MAG: DUF3047 domain-containing protein [Pseudomonadota bacterium]